MDQKLVETAHDVAAMLEHLSADSLWAHRASGLRGSLLNALEVLETGQSSPSDLTELAKLVQAGFDLLVKAAREIREN